MIVVAGGMIRSGSTFAFNIVRELLLERGTVRTFSSDDLEAPEDELSESAHVVIKTHSPNEALLTAIKARRVPCICTVRRAEDAVASWWRAFNFPIDQGVAIVKLWRRWYEEVPIGFSPSSTT